MIQLEGVDSHMIANNITPFYATRPGEVLAAELEERGITQKAFAKQIGMRPSHLSELINGKRNVTMAIADKLQEALGIDAQSWMNLQIQYNYDIKKAKNPSESATLQVSVEDTSILEEIRRAISLIRGVGKVAVL